jgi:hypothetical protein
MNCGLVYELRILTCLVPGPLIQPRVVFMVYEIIHKEVENFRLT